MDVPIRDIYNKIIDTCNDINDPVVFIKRTMPDNSIPIIVIESNNMMGIQSVAWDDYEIFNKSEFPCIGRFLKKIIDKYDIGKYKETAYFWNIMLLDVRNKYQFKINNSVK